MCAGSMILGTEGENRKLTTGQRIQLFVNTPSVTTHHHMRRPFVFFKDKWNKLPGKVGSLGIYLWSITFGPHFEGSR